MPRILLPLTDLCDKGTLFTMKKYQALLFLIAAAAINVSLCAEPLQRSPSITVDTLRPLLNSERIKLLFGSYNIDVLENGKRTRVSNLYSEQQGIKTTRTLAVVSYPDRIDQAFSSEHQSIVAGQSLGAVFKKNGWHIEKRHRYFGTIPEARKFGRVYALMGHIAPTELAIHSYDFFIKKQGDEFRYASISEVHHPDYLNFDTLKALYAGETVDKYTINEGVQRILSDVEKAMENI